MQSYRWKFPVIVFIVAGFLAAYYFFGLTLGIDLQGGSVLIYELDKAHVPMKVDPATLTKSTIDILQRRLDTLGMKEMSIRPAGDYQIMIQLPGVSKQSSDQIKQVINQAGQLWLKIVVEPGDPRYDAAALRDIEERKARGEYVMEENDFDVCRLSRDEAGAGQELKLLVMNEGAVHGKGLETADFTRDSWGRPAVRFSMKPDGRRQLAAVTEKNVGKRMAIILDDVAVSAPVLKSALTDGGEITGDFKEAKVNELITVMRSGALPAKPVLVSENTIEPTLGQESIRRGMYAMYGAVGIVVFFMFVYYHGAGAIANIALICNVIILLGFMSLFEATLTLPGIAGIVLTIGMAVDANILIYERIREEKRRGLPIEAYIDAGYSHAFWAIFDTHVTTFLSGLILNYVGTGPIKGFAVTLMIGITISFFTALFVTRAIYDYLLATDKIKNVSMIELRKDVTKIPFIQKRMPFVIASVILFNLGYLLFVVRGEEKYGIDFNGGSAIQMRLTKALTKSDIEGRLAKVEKKSADGAVDHPYVDAEVVRLGNPDDPKTGAGRNFQILISGTPSAPKAPAKKTALAPTGGASFGLMASAAAAEPTAGQPAAVAVETAAEAAATESSQDTFLHDVESTFAPELAPHAFSEKKIDPEPGSAGKGRLSFDVNFAQDQKVEVDAAKKELANDGFADADAKLNADGKSMHVTSAPIDLDPRNVERVEGRLKNVFESKFSSQISNPFPFKTSIGSSVAESLKYRAILAIVLMLLVVIVYLAFRFEFKMGLAAALCLFHDVLVVVGFMMLLDMTSKWTGIDAKQNLTTIAAYLTIVGYSINDTIVTFDRMRENLAKWDPKTGLSSGSHAHVGKETYEEVLNRSINETLGRTILTSLTVFLTLIVLAFAGVKSIESFTLAMLVGVVFGTYSSIVIATPILLVKPRKLLMICGAELAYFIVAGVIGSHLKL